MIRLAVAADTKADLVGFNSAVDGQSYIVMGNTSEADSLPRFYYYVASSTAIVDGENVLATTGMGGMGRYLKNGQVQPPVTGIADYTNTVVVTGGAGVATFYLTSDKTSSGTALYSTIDAVIPIINDVTQNYTYGWSYNSTTKALTVTAKTNLTAVISLLTVVLGPTVVPNGASIQVVVKGH